MGINSRDTGTETTSMGKARITSMDIICFNVTNECVAVHRVISMKESGRII
jgi:hypothetical protein